MLSCADGVIVLLSLGNDRFAAHIGDLMGAVAIIFIQRLKDVLSGIRSGGLNHFTTNALVKLTVLASSFCYLLDRHMVIAIRFTDDSDDNRPIILINTVNQVRLPILFRSVDYIT
jgi:uncharacterized protein with PQ loop repeat